MEIRKYWLYEDKGFISLYNGNKALKIEVERNSLKYNGNELAEQVKEEILKLLKIEMDDLDVSTSKEVSVGYMRTKTVMSKTAIRNSYIKDYFYRALNLKEVKTSKTVQSGVNIKIIDIYFEQFQLKIIVKKDDKKHTLNIKNKSIYYNDIQLKENPELLVLRKAIDFLEKKSTLIYSTRQDSLKYSHIHKRLIEDMGLIENQIKYEKVFKRKGELV
ncbi:hypothetical protein SAMN02745174_02508 [Cetobacterium ceti]|uniref:Uncharacterized protein n=1 Tax=Cetobacterium ceti TaxID=180163 RepID=A0A1T4QYM1_9FUSO|nr:hypothetical protein [Cetobacterium ceti]SKA08745.1 hypothetical protein SAMN02745174_02508 [Cetobacterium ceti]